MQKHHVRTLIAGPLFTYIRSGDEEEYDETSRWNSRSKTDRPEVHSGVWELVPASGYDAGVLEAVE